MMDRNLRIILAAIWFGIACAAEANDRIRLNQIGFYPEAEKIAIVDTDQTVGFHVRRIDDGMIVFEGQSAAPRYWSHSDEMVAMLDFSTVTAPGRYRVHVDGIGESHTFSIHRNVHLDVLRAAIKAFYYNRASTSLQSVHAGVWARAAGHADLAVRIHESAASAARPANSTFASPKGWYDAGDYGKYIVNSGISTYTLMAAFEHFPELFATLEWNIPESGNTVPDLLDEIRWNLDWMMTMQDPNDGGVYHKLTTKNFPGIIMPAVENFTARYVVMKTTSATLNFAAVMAVAARVYEPFDAAFADDARAAAVMAYQWAAQNPTVYYQQPADITTGAYGDSNVSDEFDWAAAELYILTGDDAYYTARNLSQVGSGVPSWAFTRPLLWISLAQHRDHLSSAANQTVIRQRIINQANTLLGQVQASAFRTTMGGGGQGDFHWGSNGFAANKGMMLIQAYRLTEDDRYLDAALANLDYILGRNATGYSFVTGHGSKTPMFIHHRPSAADGITAPVPGFVAGGPNARREDNCSGYPSTLPALSYQDTWCSYATNEVAINWNAPLVYLLAAAEALKGFGSTSVDDGTRGAVPEIHLYPAYPNPFNPSTVVRYRLTAYGKVTLTVHDILGREVAVLADGDMPAGSHEAIFRASGLGSGTYLLRLTMDGHSQTRGVILMR